MCGIAGQWSPPGVAPFSARSVMDGALDRMRRRGPDDRGSETYQSQWGSLAFGHARLAVIDLSAGGHQPRTTDDGRYSLVFNGEIYNYRELRAELATAGVQFRSQSDSEVLIAAWQRWGEDCVHRLNGIFAFAIVDHEQGVLTCVRDPFGIKPLFYASNAGGLFCFASELSAVVALRGAGAGLNHQRVYDYLVHGDYDSNAETFVCDVSQLPPASMLQVDMARGGTQTLERWWTPRIEQRSKLHFADAAASLREIFLRNVRLQLRSDVALGAALSGGIDSSAVVCAMRHIEPDMPIHTFSFIAPGAPVSEERWIRLVCQHVNSAPNMVEVHPGDLATDLDDMIRAQGEPFGSTSIYAQYRVFKLAREQGITVTLDGQGADELLGGYLGYPGQRLHSFLDAGDYMGAARFLQRWAQWPDHGVARGLKLLLAHTAGPRLYGLLRRLAGSGTEPRWLHLDRLAERGVQLGFHGQHPSSKAPGRRVMEELALSCSQRGLPALLRHADRNSMRFSVESRVPFLTTEMADFMFSLPEHYLVSNGGETKAIFRQAMRGMVPDEVLNRRDKIGFATPESEWLQALRPQVREWVGAASGPDFLDRKSMLAAIETLPAGSQKFSAQVWRWINFIRWHEIVFKDMQ